MIKKSLIDEPHDLVRYDAWEAQWEEPETLGLHEYISEKCHPEDVLICSRLFFPEFIVVDNCVLLYERYEENNFLAWKLKFPQENSAVEKMINHTHVYDLFGSIADNVSDSVFNQLCIVMKCSWRMTLKEVFPEKEFIIESSNDDAEYGPTLTFYQKD